MRESVTRPVPTATATADRNARAPIRVRPPRVAEAGRPAGVPIDIHARADVALARAERADEQLCELARETPYFVVI